MPPAHVTGAQRLVIDGSSIDCPAWWPLDYGPLHQPAAVAGENIPLSEGRMLALPQYETESEIDLPMVIDGDYSVTGGRWGDYEVGHEANLAALRAIVAPVRIGDGCRPATHHLASGGFRVARIQAQLILGDREASVQFAVLAIRIPSGRFV